MRAVQSSAAVGLTRSRIVAGIAAKMNGSVLCAECRAGQVLCTVLLVSCEELREGAECCALGDCS